MLRSTVRIRSRSAGIMGLHGVVPVFVVDKLHRVAPVRTRVDDPAPAFVAPVVEGADRCKCACEDKGVSK